MTTTGHAKAADELTDALAHYDTNAKQARLMYATLRVITLVVAAAIPVVAVVDGSSVVTAILGSAIVVIEGLQQLGRFHDRWLGYRTAWNALERERRLVQSQAGPYADSDTPDQLLAERMNSIIESETRDWATSTAAAKKKTTPELGG